MSRAEKCHLGIDKHRLNAYNGSTINEIVFTVKCLFGYFEEPDGTRPQRRAFGLSDHVPCLRRDDVRKTGRISDYAKKVRAQIGFFQRRF